MKKSKSILIPVFIFALSFCCICAGEPLSVGPDSGSYDFTSIQTAIDSAGHGDVIVVAPGTYYEAIDFLGKAVRLYSSGGPAATTIDAEGLNSSVVRCVNGEGPDTILEGFTLTGGNTGEHGGGMYNSSSSPTVIHCTFSNNTAGLHGGGMMNNLNSSPTVVNCLFSQNDAGAGGGGIGNSFGSNATVTNCTFINNTASSGGGGMYNYHSSPTITNCIVWGNSPEQISNDSSTPAVAYSNIQNGFSGIGNIDADPLFMDAAGGDFRLRSSASPCADAGDNSVVTEATDLRGNPRIVDGRMYRNPIVDQSDYALRFDGIDDDTRISNHLSLQSEEGTVCAWIKTPEAGASYRGIVTKLNGWYLGTHQNTLMLFDHGTGQIRSTGLHVADGHWQHIAFSYRQGTANGTVVYVNGAAVLTTTISFHPTNPNTSMVLIGRGYSGQNFAGIISDVCFYDSVLSAGEIQEIYAGTVTDAGLVGRWLLNEGVGTTAYDSSGNDRNGTIYGGAAWVALEDTVDMGAYEFQPMIHNLNQDARYEIIQTAIEDADDDDEIVVSPGTYGEAINFNGKAVRLYSSGGPEVTTINGTGHYHVVQCVSGEGPDTILEGFTLAGGNANGPTDADNRGGGMRISYSSPTVIGCIFENNFSAGPGGGMYIESGSPAITHCSFIGNSSNSSGGGMYIRQSSNPKVTNCNFSGNSAASGGGGMVNTISTQSKVTNCIFVGNSTAGNGGAIWNYWFSHVTLTNCTFSQNTAANGGGIYNSGPSHPTVVNSILWSNIPNQFLNLDGSNPAVTYSNIQSGSAGTGNLDADPLFVDAGGGNLRLGRGSPCIDAGNNDAVPTGVTTDLNGWSRFIDDPCTTDTGSGTGTIVDIGAYEFLPADINGSGQVNFIDFTFVASHWKQSGGDSQGTDMNCDGIVELADLLTLAEDWLEGI